MPPLPGVIERCYGCKAERDISQPHYPWPQVSAPGAFPYDELRKDRLCICPTCAEKIKEPILTIGDLERQLGHVPYFVKESAVRVDPKEPFWSAFVKLNQKRRKKDFWSRLKRRPKV